MKDEIKEILEDNGELMVRYKDNSFECFDTLPKNVVDYITNLQEEKEIYKKEKDILMNSLFITRNKYNNDKTRYIRKAKNYKTRIYKAIKYIKEKSGEVELNFYGFPDKIISFKGSVSTLLNILQGEQNE